MDELLKFPLLAQVNMIKQISAGQADYQEMAFYFTCLALFDFKKELSI